MGNCFKILFIIGRPAAGKSEIIDFLKKTDPIERIDKFHIGNFEEIDDFQMLWTWFEEDDILEKMGRKRLHTDKNGYFKKKWLWDLLIRRMNLEYQKKLIDKPEYENKNTAILEFARGTEHGGFAGAFSNFSEEILRKAAVLYLNVSFEESLRKNRKRFNPDKPYSILEHSLPDEKLDKLYCDSDWERFSSGNKELLKVNGINVPYAVFENEDDVTTTGGRILDERLEKTLKCLWNIRKRFTE